MPALIDTLIRSLVRTLTPWLVGLAVVVLAKVGLTWEPSTDAFVTVATVVSAVFYTLVRLAEEKLGAKWGILLGQVGAPSYESNTPDTALLEPETTDFSEFAPQA